MLRGVERTKHRGGIAARISFVLGVGDRSTRLYPVGFIVIRLLVVVPSGGDFRDDERRRASRLTSTSTEEAGASAIAAARVRGVVDDAMRAVQKWPRVSGVCRSS